jgi:hypothetical protein
MERTMPRKRPRPSWKEKDVDGVETRRDNVSDVVNEDDTLRLNAVILHKTEQDRSNQPQTETCSSNSVGVADKSNKSISAFTAGKRNDIDYVDSKQQDSTQILLTPHTLRLLKLIQEGSSEHAKLAADQLSVLTKDSSPLVLWEILGRLQSFMVSPHWTTRSNAGCAMEGVAQHLPQADQDTFLNGGNLLASSTCTPSAGSANKILWLTLDGLIQNKLLMTVILERGQLLVSSAESRFQVEEEEENIHQFDQSQRDDVNFSQLRLEVQRQIIARRLGLSELGRFQGEWLTGELSKDLEILPATSSRISNDIDTQQSATIGRPVQKRMKKTDDKKLENMSIRTLLTTQIRRHQQSSRLRDESQPDDREDNIRYDCVDNLIDDEGFSHRSAQILLAGELVYRMFDSSWHVRHGSLIGILSLMRAWKAHRRQIQNSFGVWPHDILARCLCVLALDRFGDYSGTSSESFSNGIVAPVREMAGQVFAFVFSMCPECLQRKSLFLLDQLARYEEWEVRHGALIALKYVMALLQTASSIISQEGRLILLSDINDLAVQTLEDENDDVQSVTAQLISLSLKEDANFPSQDHSARNHVLTRLTKALWNSLLTVRSVSSSIQDLVSLFAEIIASNEGDVLPVVSELNNSTLNGLVRILERFNELLECDYITVKTTIMRIIGTLGPRLAELLNEQSTSQNVDDVDIKSTRDLYCRIVKNIYNIYRTYSFSRDDANNSELNTLLDITEQTWTDLAEASISIFQESTSTILVNLEKHLLLEYFDLNDNSSLKWRNLVDASSGSQLRCRLDQSRVIARFLCLSRNEKAGVRHDVLHPCLVSFLNSPFFSQCEAACFLVDAIANLSRNSCSAHLNETIELSMAIVEQRLSPLIFFAAVDEGSKQSDTITASNILTHFCASLEMVTEGKVTGQIASAAVVEHWKKIAVGDSLSTGPVTLDWMRKSSVLAGTLTASAEYLPPKLTPVVRPLMTSIQNERDKDCQRLTRSFIERFLGKLTISVSAEKVEGYNKTFSKVLANLCNIIISSTEPGCREASLIIGSLVHELPGLTLGNLEPVRTRLAAFVDSSTSASADEKRSALMMLRAACCSMSRGSATTDCMLKEYVPELVHLLCVEQDQDLRSLALSLVRDLCAVDEESVLDIAIPILLPFLDVDNDNRNRKSACEALRSILHSSKAVTSLCPFVRPLLPVVMTLMTDSLRSCAAIGANIFASLVQVAPLVKAQATSTKDKSANLVIDHLILGKKIPDCTMNAYVAQALDDGGIALRSYQLEGISWLRFLQSVKLNGALCDSMGLGKTLQALVAVALAHTDENKKSKNRDVSLVVCPSSVVGHWMNEIDKFFPHGQIFRPVAVMGTPSQRKAKMKDATISCNLVVTSYATLRSDIEDIASVNWLYCILDEGHLLRNPKTATARASRRLRSRHSLILTGTPVQNKVNEVWATFDFLMPNFLGSATQFTQEFARPISKGQIAEARAVDIACSMEKLKLLHQQVLPFILRREKEAVLKELPPKVVTRIPCPMSPVQERMYQQFCSSEVGHRSILALNQSVAGIDSAVASEPLTIGSDIFKSLLYLRLLCTHPWLVKGHSATSDRVDDAIYHIDVSGKLMALKELLRDAGIAAEELSAADNDSSLLYCEDADDVEIDGFNAVLDPSVSDALQCNMQDATNKSASRCLIFAQFTHSLDLVEDLLLKSHMPAVQYLRLDGKVPASKRCEIVDTFNRDDRFKILLLTTRIGGLGLNLTGADTVIFLEHDWNPHSDLQAMDRAHRIGQKKTVNVYQLVTVNSIEEKTMLLHEKKLAMSAAIVNTENSSMYSMGTDRLLDIFQYRSDVTTEVSHQSSDLETALDALVERYESEYQSLSIRDFISGLEGARDDTETLLP